jgi:dTDP-4-amino-4,6-dideoxygalactose transaminase
MTNEQLVEKVRTGLYQARTCPAVEWAYAALAAIFIRLTEAEKERMIARSNLAGVKQLLEDDRAECKRYKEALEQIVGVDSTHDVAYASGNLMLSIARVALAASERAKQ